MFTQIQPYYNLYAKLIYIIGFFHSISNFVRLILEADNHSLYIFFIDFQL